MSEKNGKIRELKADERSCLWPLIGEWQESALKTCIQGFDGRAWLCGDGCALQVRNFVFFAGEPDTALLCDLEEELEGHILVPQDHRWNLMLQVHFRGRLVLQIRHAILKEPEIFNTSDLQKLADTLPRGYELRPMDDTLYRQAMLHPWSEEHRPLEGLRIGACIVFCGELVAAASPFSRFSGGIEVQIHTREDHRRKGLATACAAALILQCIEQGLYPSWDARHMASVRIAQRLGYHYDRPYPAYYLKGSINRLEISP